LRQTLYATTVVYTSSPQPLQEESIMKNFTGTVQGQTFEDPALFEVAAKTWRAPKTHARKDFGVAPTKGENEDLVRAATGSWKAPRSKEFVDPSGLEVGASVRIAYSVRRGEDRVYREADAQVWCLGDAGGVWLADGENFVHVTKSGIVSTVTSASGEFVGKASGEIAA
jgi:hypothetical protein